MTEKPKAKIVTSFRFSWFTVDLIKKMRRQTGKSGAQLTEEALVEYYRNHPEYHLPEAVKEG